MAAEARWRYTGPGRDGKLLPPVQFRARLHAFGFPLSMQPDPSQVTLGDNLRQIRLFLQELVLRPRRDLAKWAGITKQTPNIKLGYPGQHLASLVTGIEGLRTGARGHDLRDKSEVKSCSRVDQLDKCLSCKAAVSRIETTCPSCGSTDVERKNDSKWLFAVKSTDELELLLDEIPRVVLILADYPNFSDHDWNSLQFQVFELWPKAPRHLHFRTLMENYYSNIYLTHIQRRPNATPAPKNFWPYSFQFYMCNPVRVFHCTVANALRDPRIQIHSFVEPTQDRSQIAPLPMPVSILNRSERTTTRSRLGNEAYYLAESAGLTEEHRLALPLRGTDHATPQKSRYRRGER